MKGYEIPNTEKSHVYYNYRNGIDGNDILDCISITGKIGSSRMFKNLTANISSEKSEDTKILDKFAAYKQV
jgi:hypothetical protein